MLRWEQGKGTIQHGVILHFPVLLSYVSFSLQLGVPTSTQPAFTNPFSDFLHFPELLTKL